MISLLCSGRALYLSDNEFEHLSPDIKNLKNLRILAIRDNDLVDVPQEIGELSGLRELHLQGNRLTVLPPSLGHLDFLSSRSILKLDNNPWVPPIEDQLMLGVSHVIEYIRTGETVNSVMPRKPLSELFFRDLQISLQSACPGQRSSPGEKQGEIFIQTGQERLQSFSQRTRQERKLDQKRTNSDLKFLLTFYLSFGLGTIHLGANTILTLLLKFFVNFVFVKLLIKCVTISIQ